MGLHTTLVSDDDAPRTIAGAAMAVTLAFLSLSSQAAELRPDAAFIAGGGSAMHGTSNLTAGLQWSWPWRHLGWRGEWSGMTEAFLSRWNRPDPGGRQSLVQIGLLPVLRYRFDGGSSPWFVDGGIGMSYTSDLYCRGTKPFSTRFNFIDVLETGRSFGGQREHEVSLRLSHVSNGGFRKPNPGENFVQLRYARRF